MSISKTAKTATIEQYRAHTQDTGSAGVQIALLTQRINDLTGHFKSHTHDNHSRHGLLKLVSKRRKLLNYLRSCDVEAYQQLVDQLNLRK